MKYLVFIIASFFVFMAFSTPEINLTSILKVDTKVIYPKYRIWTTPSMGEVAAFNSPRFRWPSEKKAKYSIRISSSRDFKTNLIEKEGIPFAIFNPHKKLNAGIWYWQYEVNNGQWNAIDSFTIKSSTRVFSKNNRFSWFG